MKEQKNMEHVSIIALARSSKISVEGPERLSVGRDREPRVQGPVTQRLQRLPFRLRGKRVKFADERGKGSRREQVFAWVTSAPPAEKPHSRVRGRKERERTAEIGGARVVGRDVDAHWSLQTPGGRDALEARVLVVAKTRNPCTGRSAIKKYANLQLLASKARQLEEHGALEGTLGDQVDLWRLHSTKILDQGKVKCPLLCPRKKEHFFLRRRRGSK